jgi:hypothetical protein
MEDERYATSSQMGFQVFIALLFKTQINSYFECPLN